MMSLASVEHTSSTMIRPAGAKILCRNRLHQDMESLEVKCANCGELGDPGFRYLFDDRVRPACGCDDGLVTLTVVNSDEPQWQIGCVDCGGSGNNWSGHFGSGPGSDSDSEPITPGRGWTVLMDPLAWLEAAPWEFRLGRGNKGKWAIEVYHDPGMQPPIKLGSDDLAQLIFGALSQAAEKTPYVEFEK